MKNTITIRSGGPQEWASFNAITEKHRKLAQEKAALAAKQDQTTRPEQAPALQLSAKS